MPRQIRLLLCLALLLPPSVEAESYWLEFLSGQNRGEFVYQKHWPAIGSGPDSFKGSSIPIDRNFRRYGLGAGANWGNWELGLRLLSSFRTVNSGQWQDLDYWCEGCRLRNSRVDPKRLHLNDTAYAVDFQYYDAFSWSQGPVTLFENRIETELRYFFGVTGEKGYSSGLYFQTGLIYLYSKYHLTGELDSDYLTYYQRPSEPLIGILTRIERYTLPIGFGYRRLFSRFILDASLALLLGREILFDHHRWRFFDITQKSLGSGFAYRLELNYRTGVSDLTVGTALSGDRFYVDPGSYGVLESYEVKGGIEEKIIYNNLINDMPDLHTGTKNWQLELKIAKRFTGE